LAGVKREELAGEERVAPAVGDDVVVADEDGRAVTVLQKTKTDERAALEVERLFKVRAPPRVGVEIFIDGHERRLCVEDNLQRTIGVMREDRAQRVVPLHQSLARLGEFARVDRTVDVVAQLDVVQAGARVGRGVVEQPLLHR